MTEAERIDFLIRILEGGNAAAFGERIGISKSVVSRMRKGTIGIRLQINSILTAYPSVDREWLTTGDGYPGDISVDLVKTHYESKIRRADMIIDHLTKRLNELEKQLAKDR